MKVKDLQDQFGKVSRSILLCPECGGEYSADAGDYFMYPGDHVLTCCDEPLEHVTKKTVYEKV